MKNRLITRLAPMPSLLLALACLWTAERSYAVGNDNFAAAWIVSGLPYTTNSSNADATAEPGEPSHRGSTNGHSVWFRWTAPSSGPMQVNTLGSSFASVLGVYSGSTVSNLTEVAGGRGNHVVDFIAVAGVTYQIALDSRDFGGWGNFTFRLLTGVNPPANDNFANATVLSGATYSLTGATNSGATWEPGEPMHAGVPGGKSLWWRWTAPVTGPYQLDTAGSTLDTLLAVYTGTSLASLSVVASNDNTGAGFTSLVTFNAAAGTSYYFALDGWQGRSEGYLFNLNLAPPAAPAGPTNNNFANAIVFTGSPFFVNGAYNTNATKEAGEPNHAGNIGGASVWWAWTAPANGPCHVDTFGSAFDTLLAVYTGSSVGSLTLVASNNDSPTTPPASELMFNAVGGTTYHIAVDGYNGASGWITMNFFHTPPVSLSNDYFTNALVITGTAYTTNVSSVGATKEIGEPNHCYQTGGASLWWRWTPAADQTVQMDTFGSDFDTLLAVYTGDTMDSLAWVAYNDQAWGTNNQGRVAFAAKAGTTYQIAVDGWRGTSGRVVFNLGPAPTPPPNDNIATASIISVSSYSVITSNINATGEPGEPGYDPRGDTHSIWWQWKAPGYGSVEVDTTGSAIDTTLAMYSGSITNEMGTGDDDGGPGWTSRLRFRPEAGTNYHFRVDGYDEVTGIVGFRLAFTQEPSIPVNDSFSSPTVISGHAYTNYTSNRGATKQAGEPNHHANPGGHSIWWVWTAPASCGVQISTEPWFALAVYTGSAFATLVKVASDHGNDNGSGPSDVSFAAAAGVTYRIAVDGWDGAADYVTLHLETSLASLAPPNDFFTNAFLLTGAIVTATGSDANATRESGEPNHGGVSTGGSVWWRWTAPSNGVFLVNTDGSEFDTTLGVYTGIAVNALTEVASDNNRGGKFRSRVAFYATGGTNYHIALGRSYTLLSTSTGIELNIFPSPTPPPANDLFANASVISGSTFTTMTSNAGATEEPGEPNHAGDVGGSSLWWRWTAPASGLVQVDTEGSNFDTLLAVYTGSAVNALTVVTNDDNSGAGITSLLTFNAAGGTTYYIAADGGWILFNGVDSNWGNLNLHLKLTIPGSGPPNDYFAGATVVASTNYSISNYSNAGASIEAGEPNPCGFPGGASVWWRWTPPFTGLAQVDTLGASMYTILSIYTGSTVSSLAPVTCAWALGATLYFPVTNGITYAIMVDGYLGNTGSFNVHMSPAPPPPSNDNFTNAAAITGIPYTTNLSTVAATKEPGEPDHNGRTGGTSVWWKWTALAAGRMQVNTTNSNIQTLVGVYTGSSVGSLTPVARGYGNHKVYFDAVGGTAYRIAVDDSHGMGGNVNFFFGPAPAPPANDLFSSAVVLTGSSSSISNASNVAASKESGEPNPAGDAGGKSVWWRWTAPTSGPVQVDTIGSSFDTILGIYTGSAVNSLTEIASDDQSGGFNTSKTNFNAAAGTTYLIAVDGWHGQEGTVVLHLAGPAGSDVRLQRPSLVWSNGQPHLQFEVTGPATGNVVIQTLGNLNASNWTPFRTNLLEGGSTWFTDTLPATNSQRYYRVRLGP